MNASIAHVRYSHDDERFDQAPLDQALGRLIGIPFHAAKRGRRVEHVLTIMKVKDGVRSPGPTPITGWQIYQHVAPIAQNP